MVGNTPLDKIDYEGLEFTTLQKRIIAEVVECTGIIDVPPNQRAALFAPIGGNISDIKVLPGDLVKQGQLLYRLSHQDIIKIQEAYLVAYNDEGLQETNLKRKQELFETKNISERELRQAKRDFQVARANLESLAAQLQVIGLSPSILVKDGIRSSLGIKAPISGYISKVEAVSGSYVNLNSRILTIVNPDHMHLELEVYADKVNEVEEGQRVGFRIAGDDTEHWGEVYLVGKEVDEETRTVAVHAHMLKEEQLVVGSYIYAGILTKADSMWSLPESAIVSAENKTSILVKVDEQLQPMEVEVGRAFRNHVAVKNHRELQDKIILAKDAFYFFEK